MRKKKKKRQNGWWPVGWLYYLNESTSQKVVIIFQPTSLFPDLITNFFLLLSTLVSLSTEIHGQLVESDALMAHHDLFVPKWDGTKIKPKKKERTKKNNKKKKFLFPFQFFFVLFFFFASFYALTLRPAIVDRPGHNGGHGELSRATIW
jgi:hypothetical protein